jgi:unsaturated chondroitin disaccharide hydrolase
MQLWNHAIASILERMEDTRKRVGNNYPHWCDYGTGKWTTTVDGDWTGGFWPGMHWLAAKYTDDQRYRAQALALTQGLKNRVGVESVFKSFPFYFGGALGAVLFQDREATEFAIAGARNLAAMYNPTLKLIPLGTQAEEGDNVSNVESSIDSLHAAPFLLWACAGSRR